MISKRFNSSVYVIIAIFTALSAFCIYGALLLNNDVILDENGAPLSQASVTFLTAAILIVCMTWILSVISLVFILIKFKSRALRIDTDGIHDTFICVNLLAFLFTVKIDFIPWRAVKHFDCENGELYIRVHKDQIEASIFGKMLISVLGYGFCQGFVKPKFTEDEAALINSYIVKEPLAQGK